MLRLSARSIRQLQPARVPAFMATSHRAASSASHSQPDPPPGYAIDPKAGPMLRYQASLPRLPVPTLSSTAAKYLETVKPHLTASEFSRTNDAVQSFLKSPLAAQLQERLENRAVDPKLKSWLSEWWNDVAYMGYRDPVVVFVSYFYVHVDDKFRRDPAKRAASLIKAILPFRDLVESQRLEPEKVRGAPLCMDSYKWLFHSSRYPVIPSDTARKFDPAKHNHITVIRKNKFFIVSLINPSTGKELSAAELELQFQRIIDQAGSTPAPISIGALTSDNRDIWTNARSALIAASDVNVHNLEQIESSMIVVALDDTKPVTREDISWSCWVGDGKNRFYDKHQLIVFDNGRSGFLGEHSCMDGTPTLRMNEFVLASLAHGKIDLGPERAAEAEKELPRPTELVFKTNSEIEEFVKESEQHFNELVGSHDLAVLHYEGYGKDAIKKFKVSPDAWAQLIKQLAFHKMFGRPGVCYESAQTRKYQLGRTEVIRSASSESKEWAEAMLDAKPQDPTHLANLFRKAATRHIQYATWAADGQGVDRHLFGLKRVLKDGEDLPQIYKDPAFAKSSHWELSTSQLSSPLLDGWGYGEVVPDGYGLSYSIGGKYIRWTITSMKRNTAELKHYIAEAASETMAMMEKAAAAAADASKPTKL